MKTILTSLLLTVLAITTFAQVPAIKDKEFKKAVKERTKQLEKEGWVPVGSGIISLYMHKALEKEFSVDDNGQPKFMVVYGDANGGAYDAVSEDAWSAAKLKIAGNIETRVAGLIKRQTLNNKITQEQANTLSKYVGANKQLISQKVSMQDLFYFKKDNGNGQIMVRYFGYYDVAMADKIAGQELQNQMQQEANDLTDELDNIFNLGN